MSTHGLGVSLKGRSCQQEGKPSPPRKRLRYCERSETPILGSIQAAATWPGISGHPSECSLAQAVPRAEACSWQWVLELPVKAEVLGAHSAAPRPRRYWEIKGSESGGRSTGRSVSQGSREGGSMLPGWGMFHCSDSTCARATGPQMPVPGRGQLGTRVTGTREVRHRACWAKERRPHPRVLICGLWQPDPLTSDSELYMCSLHL